jgi:LemA protein
MVPALIILGVVVLLPLMWLMVIYNRFNRIEQHRMESWADIDVELKRRYELIPNLVETVKGYAKHESETLERVIELRNKARENTGSAAGQAVDESALMIGMQRLFAISEDYPELKASEGFLALQKELANTEDRIAAARRFFNANVREWNQLCRMFPMNLVAGMFKYKPHSYFELDGAAERVVPRVEL